MWIYGPKCIIMFTFLKVSWKIKVEQFFGIFFLLQMSESLIFSVLHISVVRSYCAGWIEILQES